MYTLAAWVELNETNAMSVEFTTEDLAALVPGSVLIHSRDAQGRVISREQVDQGGCRYSTGT